MSGSHSRIRYCQTRDSRIISDCCRFNEDSVYQVTVAELNTIRQDAYSSADTNLPVGKWLSRNAEMNPTFIFWMLSMKYQQLVMLFVRAHRQANARLFVETLKALVGIFFAMDHHNYARWLPVFIADIESPPSSVLVEFEGNEH